jgi:hypothetical protein
VDLCCKGFFGPLFLFLNNIMIHSSPAYSGEKKSYVQVKYTKATSPLTMACTNNFDLAYLLLNWLWFLLHVLMLWWVEPNWSPRPFFWTVSTAGDTPHCKFYWSRKKTIQRGSRDAQKEDQRKEAQPKRSRRKRKAICLGSQNL